MSWDEELFRFILKKLSGPTEPTAGFEVRLDREAPALRILACALTGENLTISAAENYGGYDGSRLFLPAQMALFTNVDDNRKAYLCSLLAAVASRDLALSLPTDTCSDPRAMSLAAIPHVRLHIERSLPEATAFFAHLDGALRDPETQLRLFGALRRPSVAKPEVAAAPQASAPDSLASGTEKRSKPRERVENVRLGESKDDENPLIHVFEKVLTADDYTGGKKNLDGEDELEEHEEALRELDLRHVIRSRERTRSIYKSDAMIDGGTPDLDGPPAPLTEAYFYDEWNYSTKSYRRGWCTVLKSTPTGTTDFERPPSSSSATIERLRSDLEKLMTDRRWRGRQIDGTELDLDALVTASADRKSGVSPSDRVYAARRRSQRAFAATILVDVSLSSDSWVENQRVIEVARTALGTLVDVFDGIVDDVSVAAFSSKTRKDCRYLELKSFAEDWSALRSRLSALKPTGYTRIGPAVRHAAAELKKNGAKKKLLLLISDGKPTDFDRYEGAYGIEDVRQAIKEATSAGLKVHALAIDAEARHYLPRMFGVGRFQILSHPGLLAPALSKLFAQCLGY